MRSNIVLVTMTLAALFLTGCLRSFSTIAVQRDGSAVITDTMLFSPRMVSMFESMSAMSDSAGGSSGAKAPFSLWNDSTINADAESFGEGVKVRSVKTLDVNGYKGYVAIFDVADITKITLSKDRAANKMASPSEAGEQPDTAEKKAISFAYDGNGHLEIVNALGVDNADDEDKDAASSPEEQRQSLDMMAGFMRGMHIRIGITVPGKITSTNAQHISGNQISMLEINFDKLIAVWDQDVALFSTFDALKTDDVEALNRELAKYPPGTIVIESQPKITVAF